MLFDCGHPHFRNLNSIIPIDVVRVKSNVNSLFNPTGVPMWVSVNKLNLIPERIVARRTAVFIVACFVQVLAFNVVYHIVYNQSTNAMQM